MTLPPLVKIRWKSKIVGSTLIDYVTYQPKKRRVPKEIFLYFCDVLYENFVATNHLRVTLSFPAHFPMLVTIICFLLLFNTLKRKFCTIKH